MFHHPHPHPLLLSQLANTHLSMMKNEKYGNGGGSATGEDEENGRGNSGIRTAETLLRILPMALCVTAMVVMLKNSQSNDYGSVSYTDLGSFRYLVYANGICAGYSFISAFYMATRRSSNSSPMSIAWTFFFFDQVMTYVVLAAAAASSEVIFLAYKGDKNISWSAECTVFGGFCRKSVVSVSFTFSTMACYAALSFISSYRVFTKYGPPVGYSTKGAEMAVFST